MLTAMEAFLGVLFAGVAGAIILGKIMRYNAIAPVTWSDPLVLKYGEGVKIEQQDASYKPRQDEPRNGNMTETNTNTDKDDESENGDDGPIPYPILEFRVGNDAFARDGGEISNVQISAWARILARNATQELRDACRSTGVNYRRLRKMRRERQQAKKKQERASPTACMHQMGHVLKNAGDKATGVGKKFGGQATAAGRKAGKRVSTTSRHSATLPSVNDEQTLSQSSMENVPSFSEPISPEVSAFGIDSLLPLTAMPQSLPETLAIGSSPGLALPDVPRGAVMMDDGDYASKCGLSRPTIYSRLVLENASHPFFKRCWHLRHQVDENSPLLDFEAHKIIREFHKSGGEGWPPDLNAHEKLRKHICFEELSVTLSGTDHITGNTVYGFAIYSTVDLAIGYRFINCLHRHPRTGQVGVDMSLINDVREQHGGGGEPLFEEDEDDEDEFDPPLRSVNVLAASTNAGEASALSEPMKHD